MTDRETKLAHRNILTSLLITISEQSTRQGFVTDLFLFLLRYSFLLNDTSKPQKSCASKTPQLNAPQGNIYMGARYLDPKYSRWISTDPALGEYASGSDAGCGGIYNHVNLNLYHYAGNNPIKYTDPDGRIYNDPFEKEFVYQVLGDVGVFAYNTTSFKILPNGFRGGSFVNGWIFYEADTFVNPMENDKNTFIHELFHQIQYFQNPACQIDLAKEYFLNEQMAKKGSIKGYETHYFQGNGGMYLKPIYDGNTVDNYTYQYSQFNLSKYKTLSDLPFYEAQAQFVGDYASLYFDARFGEGLPEYKKSRLKQMAQTMKNSGYEDTEAVRWILNDME